MVDRNRISRGMSLHKLVRRTSSPLLQDAVDKRRALTDPMQPLHHDDLVQGSLYIIKLNHITVSLFQGWFDDMCCFAILRADATPMRWSEARYLPGDFEAFPAFDMSGNPPMKLWTRVWRLETPTNWFAMFEEARRKQREWTQQGVSSVSASTDVIDPSVMAGSTPMYFLQSVSTLATDQRPEAALPRPISMLPESVQDPSPVPPLPLTKDRRTSSSLTTSSTSSCTPSVDTSSATPWQKKMRALFHSTVPDPLTPMPTAAPMSTFTS